MSEDITDKLLHQPIIIEYPEGKLIYNFSELNGWQCEMGYALGLFINDQKDNPPSSFEEQVASGSANWVTTLMSFLFFKENDENKPKDEIYSKFIKGILQGIKGKNNMPVFKEVIRDFFSGIGEEWMISVLLPNRSKENAMKKLQWILMQVLGNMNASKLPLSKGESELKTSTEGESLKEDTNQI